MSRDLFDAKVALYKALLQADQDHITDDEVELGFILARDQDIQEMLNRAVTKEREKNAEKILQARAKEKRMQQKLFREEES